MRSPFRTFRIVVLSLLAFASHASAGNIEFGTTTPSEVRPEKVVPSPSQASDGSFHYDIDLKVPKFHDLVPSIGLSYNSGNKATGSARVVMGSGWSLRGLSVITRMGPNDGVASFDGSDVYQLDGEELLACGSLGTSTLFANPFPDAYSTSRIATRANASCSYGGSNAGNMTALHEDYRRITKTGNTFIVLDKLGRRYTYRAIGQAAGIDPATVTGADFSVLFERDFVLSEVRDLQTSANVISYDYAVDAAHGWAFRLQAVNYGGYRVEFEYLTLLESNALASWGLGKGTGAIGRQVYQLNSVVVFDGTSIVRGYELTYELSHAGLRQHLKSVTEHGADLVLSGSAITSANGLPSHSFN